MRRYNSSVSNTSSSSSSSFRRPWTVFSSFFKRSRPPNCRISSSQHYNLPKLLPAAGLSCILDSLIMTSVCRVFDHQLRLLDQISNKNIVFAAGRLSAPPKFGFLLTCFRCNKNLKGLDVYVYRGEKSYCSAECRSEGIKSCVRNEEMEYFRHLSPSSQTPSEAAAGSGRVIFVVGDQSC